MFKSKVPDIQFDKNILFFVHSAQSVLPTVQDNKQIFCKTWHSLNFNVTLIMKFNLENRIFYLCPNVNGFLKKFLNDSTFKKYKLKDDHYFVARMRKFAECGSDDEMRWLTLHPS